MIVVAPNCGVIFADSTDKWADVGLGKESAAHFFVKDVR